MDLLTDYGFKFMFGNEKQKKILLHFLNAIMKGEQVITDVKYDPLDLSGDTEEIKRITVDLLCTTDTQEQVIIELQRAKQDYFRDRSIFYTSRLINEQLPKGQETNNYELRPVYFIAVLDFIMDDVGGQADLRYMRNFKLMEVETGDIFYHKLHYKFIELPKFVKTISELETEADKWLYMIRHSGTLKEKPDLNGAVFDWAFRIAEVNKLGKEERQMYIDNSLAKWEWEQALDYRERKGIEKGRHDEKIATARKMKAEGYSDVQIAKLTELQLSEVKSL